VGSGANIDSSEPKMLTSGNRRRAEGRCTMSKDTPQRIRDLADLAQRLAPAGADYELWRVLAQRRRQAGSER